jgi:ABC-2 type transport system ATP-binding protein
VLQLCDLTRRFGDRTVLDAVSMDIPPGVVVGLLGPNGAGKTTAMRIVFGVVEPDAGEVRWDGRPVRPSDRASWGYMTQERGLYPDMRVLDQLVYFGRLHGLAKAEAVRRAEELLAGLGLADRAGDVVEALSGGMQQRVQLAAALVHDPPVVVLDEPFAGLDPIAVERLSQVVTSRAAAGQTVVFSSHQLDLVEDLCESIVMLHQGRVVLSGRVADLKAASNERQLRVDVDTGGAAGDHGWLAGIPGVEVASRDSSGLRLRLDPGVDALAVLDVARGAGRVLDFGLEQPSLSELFLRAAGDVDAFADEEPTG